MSKRKSIDYWSETPNSILTISDLINSILDLIESKTNLEDDYLETRILLSLDCLGLSSSIKSLPHANENFILDILQRKTRLETTALSNYQGYLEVSLDHPDIAAGYKTIVENDAIIKNVEYQLSELNYAFLFRYFLEVNPKIEENTITLNELITLGLPSEPKTLEYEW
jgi:hypothetical protein